METTGTESAAPSEAPTGPTQDDAGHEDVSGGETSSQTGAPDQADDEGD